MYQGYQFVRINKFVPREVKLNLGLPSIDKDIDIFAYKNNEWYIIQCKWCSNEKGHIKDEYTYKLLGIGRDHKKRTIFATNKINMTPGFENIFGEWFIKDKLDKIISRKLFKFIISNNDISVSKIDCLNVDVAMDMIIE